MKARLLGPISVLSPDRTSAAGLAGYRKACVAFCRGEMRGAARDIVAGAVESADRTSAQAGPLDTALAGAGLQQRFGKIEPLGKADSAPVGMPEAKTRMYQETQWRRRKARLGLLRPAQEGRRRLVERKDSQSVELFGNGRHDPSRPAIKRVWMAIAGFGRARETRPKAASLRTDQSQGSDRNPTGQPWRRILGIGMKSAPNMQAQRR